MSAAVLAEPVAPSAAVARAPQSGAFIHTVLITARRQAVWNAWTTADGRSCWWGDVPYAAEVFESVEPVWLVLETRPAHGATELTSVTFVELGERTHVALRTETRGTTVDDRAVQASDKPWRERLGRLLAIFAPAPQNQEGEQP